MSALSASDEVFCPQPHEIRALLQTASVGLTYAAKWFEENDINKVSPPDSLGEALVSVIDSIEPVLFSLGYDLDFGEFFDGDESGWKKQKSTGAVKRPASGRATPVIPEEMES